MPTTIRTTTIRFASCGPESGQALSGRVWCPSRAVAFVARRPKTREILAADFFNSINRRRLFELVRGRLERDLRRPATDPRHIREADSDDLLWLTRRLLTGNAAQGAVLRGTAAEFARVPAHKRLINAPAETGLPIGNLTSQFFANVYLNELDQFVKHTLKCPYYVRYVDDMVPLDPDPAVLLQWRDRIAEFLAQPLFCMLASYLGHFRHANSHQLVASLWQRYPWLTWLVRLGADGRLLPTQSARGVSSMRGQWRYFAKRFAPACVLMQVGKQVELYGTDARCVAQWPGHGGTPVTRPGWAADEAGLAWPLARRDDLLQRLTQQGLAWVYVVEQGWLKSGALKQRALRCLHWPAQMSLALNG